MYRVRNGTARIITSKHIIAHENTRAQPPSSPTPVRSYRRRGRAAEIAASSAPAPVRHDTLLLRTTRRAALSIARLRRVLFVYLHVRRTAALERRRRDNARKSRLRKHEHTQVSYTSIIVRGNIHDRPEKTTVSRRRHRHHATPPAATAWTGKTLAARP